jgi:hypothetical protein
MAAIEEEQAEMWPELDTTVAEQKAVLRIAKRLYNARAERTELLTNNKEKVDSIEQELAVAMEKAGIVKFKHDGVQGELYSYSGKTRVRVKMEADEEDADEE